MTKQEWRKSPWSLMAFVLTWAIAMWINDAPMWFTCAVAFFLPFFWQVMGQWLNDHEK